ncbi:MAG: hypothetical protein ACREVV_08405 [Steroidobacteraceae bacterium]
MSIRIWTIALLIALATAGCGTRVGKGPGGTGGGGGSTPLVVITPIGHKATSAAKTDPVAITVRSGADVILSGKDSDGGSVALTSFAWAQTGGPPLPALPDPGALLYRTSNTVSFRAPQVAAATKFSFRLTVTSAEAVAGTANADVTVEPASDPNQFLIPAIIDGPPPQKFQVVVATAEGLSGLTANVPVCVRVLRTVQYRGSAQGPTDPPLTADLPQLPALQADTSWIAADGAVAAVNSNGSSNLANAVHSYTNPRVLFDLPTFNDEDLFALFNQPVAGESTAQRDARLANELLPSDMDTARLHLSVTATAGSCNGTSNAPALATRKLVLAVLKEGTSESVVLQAQAAAQNAVAALDKDGSGATLTSDALLAAVSATGTPESLASATAYYRAIDPPAASHPKGSKLTLDDWLDANCFDHSASDYGVGAAGANGAHAVYTNNFDLGFGRDMYFMKCAADHKDAAGNVTAHKGDMASVVINYSSLEQTALKQSPIIAVAMEYSAAAGSSTRYTRFYVFAPDQRDGGFERVSSANFDKRGQKYVPGACLSCHGGAVTDATFAAGGNVDASFMPWDLDALLYSDTDPAFTGNLVGGSPYTRSAQEAGLKKLNALAYQTWLVPEAIVAPKPTHSTVTTCTVADIGNGDCIDRFAAPKTLVEKWYGGDPNASTSTAYSDAITPDDWKIAGQTPPSDLYHQAFAHYCRSCHTQNNVSAKQFSSYTLFEQNYITATTTGTGTSKLLQDVVFHKAQMPSARLTADRFWVEYGGGMNAASILAKQAETVLNSPGLLLEPSGSEAIAPGLPVVAVSVQGAKLNDGGSVDAARLDQTRADASASFFTPGYDWNLCRYAAPPPGGPSLPDITDPNASCDAVAGLVGSASAAPGFSTTPAGIYKLTLKPGSDITQTAAPHSFMVKVKRTDPSVSACTVEEPVGQTVSIALASCGTGPQNGDGTNTAFLAPSQASPVFAPPAQGNPWSQSAAVAGSYSACVYDSSSGAGPPSPCPATQPTSPGRAISLLLDASVTTLLKLDYELCDSADQYCAGSTISIQPSTLSANAAPYAVRLPAVSGFTPPAGAPTTVTDALGSLTIPADAWQSASAEIQCLGALTTAPQVLSLAQFYAVKPCTDSFKLTFTNAQGGSPSTSGPNASGLVIGPTTLGQADLVKWTPTVAQATCDYAGLNCIANGFDYSITGVSGTKGPEAVSVQVWATTSFGQSTISNGRIYDDLGGAKCATCHNGAIALATQHWKYDSTPAATVPTFTAAACSAGTGGQCIDTANPANSLLYTYPCKDTNGHGFTDHGGYVDDTSQQLDSTTVCPKLLQWLTEGAQNN